MSEALPPTLRVRSWRRDQVSRFVELWRGRWEEVGETGEMEREYVVQGGVTGSGRYEREVFERGE